MSILGACHLCAKAIEPWFPGEELCFACTDNQEQVERSIEPVSDEELELHSLLTRSKVHIPGYWGE